MDESTSVDPVLWSVDDRGVAHVILNRPEVSNAYNGDLIASLLEAFDELGRRPLRAAVITGRGRNFQAGADVNWLDAIRRSSPAGNLRASRMTARAIQRLNVLPISTVALVQEPLVRVACRGCRTPRGLNAWPSFARFPSGLRAWS